MRIACFMNDSIVKCKLKWYKYICEIDLNVLILRYDLSELVKLAQKLKIG